MAIKAKAKTSLLSFSILQEIDHHIAYSKQLAMNTKCSPQEAFIRDLRTKNFKSQNQDSKLTVFQLFEATNKTCKKTKKD